MPRRAYDLDRQLARLKADERMLGFAGFTLFPGDDHPVEGMLKIGRQPSESRDGFLSLAFIVDVDHDRELAHRLARAFSDLREEDIGPRLGASFEYLADVELAAAEEALWFVFELNLRFRNLEGQEQRLIQGRVVPALTVTLPIHLEDVEWWDSDEAELDESSALSRILDFFRGGWGR